MRAGTESGALLIQKLPVAALFFAALAVPMTAQSPGFDCGKAASPQEKAICASPELSKADAAMSAAYKAWLDAAPESWQSAIRESQRVWLRERTLSCKTSDASHPLSECLLGMDESRAKALQGMVQRRNGIPFVWRPLTFTAPDSPDVAKMMRENGQPDYGTVTVSWPTALIFTPNLRAWNQEMADAANSTDSPDGKHKTRFRKASAVDQDVDVTVTLNTVSSNLISASIARYEYGHGAAHPNHGVTQFNWWLKDKRHLTGSDIFRSRIHWSNELYKRVDAYLHKTLDSDGQSYESFSQPGEMKKTVQKLVADPSRWQIDGNGITIVFNPYEVACYACTPEPFTMSWESLKPLLNPSFQIPR